MSKYHPDYSIYLVTDTSCLQGRGLTASVEQAILGGVTIVQYRNKKVESGQLYSEALELKALCKKYNVPLIINDRIDIALAVGAAGVHLGQDDVPCAVARRVLGPDFLIGVSAHNPHEAMQAAADGADYLGCGAVFGTVSKAGVSKLGLNNLRNIRSTVSIPIVGIGGINIDNYAQVLDTGVEGAAIISGILAVDDIRGEVAKLVAIKNGQQQ